MSSIFITADEHYGHRNIISYCGRPFHDTDHMREELIARHNAKVGQRDVLTIHVGDMFWNSMTGAEARAILERLNGRHAFIYGNHDEVVEKNPTVKNYFNFVVGTNKDSGVKSIYHDGTKIVLCHYAMRVWDRSHTGSWMLYGHSHNELPVVGKSFDIGVDGHNFEPWSLDEIATKIKTLDQHHVIKPEDVWEGKEIFKPGGCV